MERYCIYLRKSRADLEAEARGEGETLSRHRNALTELAKRMKLNISAVYEEIVSGETIAARPQMQRLLSEVGAGEWDGVLVMEIERLARGDTMDQGLVAQAFKYSETKIITPIKTYDPTNEFDEEYFEFGLFMARREFTTTNRRLVRGREASAKEGKYVGSVAPYGYKKVKIEKDKGFTLEIVPEQAEIVRMIFKWYTDGAEIDGEKKRLGPHAIAVHLNELGIKSVGGKDYWTIYGVKNMLNNPVYVGKIRWGYRKVKRIVTTEGKKKIRENAQEGEYYIVDGLHDAIITEDVWKKTQTLLHENPPTPVQIRTKQKNPFAGVLYCTKCGHSMTLRGECPSNKYAYIGCNTAGCHNIGAPFSLVEERFLGILRSWAAEYQVPKDEEKREEKKKSELKSAITALEKECAELKKQQNNVFTFFERGTYTEELFRRRSASLEAQISETEARLEAVKLENELALKRQQVRHEFAPAISQLLEVYDKLTPAEKNTWFKQIVERAYYEKNESGQNRTIPPDRFNLQVFPRLPKNGG